MCRVSLPRQKLQSASQSAWPLQVFSLAYGTVHEELQSLKRRASGGGRRREGNLVAKVDEAGTTFRSYRCIRGGNAESCIAGFRLECGV